MYLTPFSSAASVASSLAGAAYEGLLGPDGEGRQKGALHDAAAAAERAQQMAIHLAEMLVFARTDLDTALTPGAHVVRGIREVGYRATQVFQRLRSTTLEFLSLEGSSSNAELLDLSRQLWQSWHAKHEALTAAERLYSTLLSESRRVGALTAELSCVTSLVDEEGDAAQSSGPCQVSGTAALERCQAQIRAQAAEAIQAFKDRAKDYPCGSPHPQTGLLRIARTEEDLRSICEAFSASVLEQETELLTQVEELAVTTELRTLTSSLSRRVAFWEGQIEENWSQWSFQSGRFHEAQTGAVECWEQLRTKAQSLLEQAQPCDATHKVLLEVACTLALLGAWANFHNLRGDGHVLMEFRELLQSILVCLDTHFAAYKGRGAVKQQLLDNDSWQLMQVPLESPGRDAWWHPAEWQVPGPATMPDAQRLS